MGLTRPRAYQIYDIDYKQAVRVVTVSNVSLSGGAPSQVDGVNLSTGDRVLVTGQSTGSLNGIYQVSVVGTGSDGTWVRSTDTNTTGELLSGTIVMVTEGETYADTSWKLTTNDPITIGVTALVWELNTGDSWGIISANGTSVFADSASDTVYFATANNLIITGNATSDTITFEVSQDPNFSGTLSVTGNATVGNLGTAGLISATGNITGGNLKTGAQVIATGNITGGNLISSARIDGANLYVSSLTANRVVFANTGGQLIDSQNFTFDGSIANIDGQFNVTGLSTYGANATFSGHLLPSANVTYDIGTPTQRWRSIYVGANTIDIGGATISANLTTGSLILTGPDGAEFILTGTSATNSDGAFGYLTIGSNAAATSTTSGAVQVLGGMGLTGNIYAGGKAVVTGNIEGANLTAVSSGIVEGGTLTGTLVLSSGNITGNNLNANIGMYTGTLSATGNITGGNLNTAGLIVATGNITGGNLNTSSQVVATGNVNGGNLVTAGIVDSTGNVQTAQQLVSLVQDPTPPLSVASSVTVNNLSVQYLDGYQRSTTAVPNSITARDSSSNVAANSISVSEKVFYTSNSAANIHFANANAIVISTASGANAVTFENTGVTVTGNVNGGNIVTAGNVTASYFLGNVSQASGIFTTKIFNGTSEANIGSSGGNFAITIDTAPNVAVFSTTGANITGAMDVTGNITGGNLVTLGDVSTGTLTTTGLASFGANVNITGNLVVSGNVTYVGVTDLTVDDPLIYLAANNNADLDDIGFIGNWVKAPTNYQHGGFVRDQSDGVWKVFSNVKPEPTNTVDFSNAIYDPLKIGALTTTTVTANSSITATGNIDGGNINTAGKIVATGNVTAGAIDTTGNISGSYIIGNGYNLTDVTTTSISVGNVSLSANATALTFSVAGNTIVVVDANGLQMNAPIAMGGEGITGLGSPTAGSDAATKDYVDGAAGTSDFPTGDYGDLASAATDSFGIPIAPLTTWDNEDPYGSLETEDLGVLT